MARLRAAVGFPLLGGPGGESLLEMVEVYGVKVQALVSITVLATFLLMGTASADGPPPGIDPEQPRYDWGPYDSSKMGEPPDDWDGQVGSFGQFLVAEYGRSRATAGDCTYDTRVDNPHKSAGQVSVHGWWERVSVTGCPSRADVTTVLQAVVCDSWSERCWWSQVARDEDRIRPGGGRGKRVTARVNCSSDALVGFRGVADVDLPGIWDPGNVAYSREVNLTCYPDP